MMQDGYKEDGAIFPRTLRRHVILLLLVKFAALFVIYRIFFAPYETPPLGQGAMAHHLFGP